MANYISAFSLQHCSVSGDQNVAFLSTSLINFLSVALASLDDGRGSGR
ncbi:hypothetical protein [Lyngbya aestuarii]